MGNTLSTLRRDRGVVLVMVLAIIAIIALLVAGFATVTRLEKKASQNFLDGEQSRFIAWSGLERAKYELRRAAGTRAYPGDWVAFHPAESPPRPIEEATRPSFRLHLDPAPARLAVAPPNQIPWPSGVVGSSYYVDPDNQLFGGDYYTLKVLDNSGLIYLNDSNPHLRKMLNALASFVSCGETDVGRKIIAARPPGGFGQVADILTVFSNEADYRAIEPYLTCHAWVDQKVVESGEQFTEPDIGQSSRVARNPTLNLQPRAPVCVNSAPLPVLVACLEGIGYGGSVGAPTSSVSSTLAQTVAQAIIDYRSAATSGGTVAGMTPRERRYGFQSWGEFYGFLRNVPGVSTEMAAIILANCNPNTDLNKLVPDLSIHRMVDKHDLTSATTEFCLASGGVYTIESMGVILDKNGEIAAQSKVRAVVRAYERYVETSQLDFETNRVDPSGPNADLPGLRDMTSLPEYRNAADPAAGQLMMAEYDGQVAFNSVTQTAVSTDGAFAGFLRSRINAHYPDGGGDINMNGHFQLARGGPLATVKSVIGGTTTPSTASPNFVLGSDLHPMGARTSSFRALSWDQNDVIATVPHEVPQSEIILTDGHGDHMETLAVIPGWTYSAVDASGFELWFKPAFPDSSVTSTGKQYLLDWESDEPQPAATSFESSDLEFDPEDFHDSVHAVFPNNVDNYLAAVAAGGPGPESPETFAGVEHPAGALGIPPPDPGSLFPPLPFGDWPYGPGADSSTPGVQEDAEAFALMIEDYYKTEFAKLLNESIGSGSGTEDDDITWGAHARLEIWLERNGADSISEIFQLKARFTIYSKGEPGTFNGDFIRDWVYDGKIRPGTWHHALASFWSLPPPASAAPPDRLNLAVDAPNEGPLVPPTTSTAAFPTEQHAQARIAAEVIASVGVGGIVIEFNPEEYRVPVEFPLGDVVTVGKDNAGQQAFSGLIDNVIFQGNWPKVPKAPTLPSSALKRRFDDYRPSKDKIVEINLFDPPAGDEVHLFYNKRIPILEWDRSVTVMGYHWTAWRYAETAPMDYPSIAPGGSQPVGFI